MFVNAFCIIGVVLFAMYAVAMAIVWKLRKTESTNYKLKRIGKLVFTVAQFVCTLNLACYAAMVVEQNIGINSTFSIFAIWGVGCLCCSVFLYPMIGFGGEVYEAISSPAISIHDVLRGSIKNKA